MWYFMVGACCGLYAGIAFCFAVREVFFGALGNDRCVILIAPLKGLLWPIPVTSIVTFIIKRLRSKA